MKGRRREANEEGGEDVNSSRIQFKMALQVIGKAPVKPRTIESIILSTDKRLKDPRSATLAQQDLRTLRHPNLENHPDFIELKERLEAYFEDRNLPLLRQKMLVHKSRNWREVLFNSLFELLSELTFTQDPEQQMQLLLKVKKWYEEKTTSLGALPQPVQVRPRPATATASVRSEIMIDKRPEEAKHESISKIVAQHSPTKSAQSAPPIQPSDNKFFYERARTDIAEADYERSNRRFNELREREINELRAIATKEGKD
jgi:hypothetical protein